MSVPNYDSLGRKAQFLLNTNGCCFICFKPVEKSDDLDLDMAMEGKDVEETYSLHTLCRHLNLNLTKVLHRVATATRSSSTFTFTEEVIPILEKSEVRVRLCARCGEVAAKFTELFRILEFIQMEIGHCFKLLHGWIRETDGEVGMVDQFRRTMESDNNAFIYLGIVEELRREIGSKCSATLASAQPKVKLERLRLDQEIIGEENTSESSTDSGVDSEESGNEPGFPDDEISQTGDRPHSEVAVAPAALSPVHKATGEGMGAAASNDLGTNSGPYECDQNQNQVAPPFIMMTMAPMRSLPVLQVMPFPLPETVVAPESVDSINPPPPLPCSAPESEFRPNRKRRRTTSSNHNPITKEYPCTVCGLTFMFPDNLKFHEENVHPDLKPASPSSSSTHSQNHKCSICQKEFSSQRKVTKHFAKIHLGGPIMPATLTGPPYQTTVQGNGAQSDMKEEADAEMEIPFVEMRPPYDKSQGVAVAPAADPLSDISGFFASLDLPDPEPYPRVWKCGLCPSAYTIKSSLYRHRRQKHSDQIGICTPTMLSSPGAAPSPPTFGSVDQSLSPSILVPVVPPQQDWKDDSDLGLPTATAQASTPVSLFFPGGNSKPMRVEKLEH